VEEGGKKLITLRDATIAIIDMVMIILTVFLIRTH
jgi:hypothetical protein